MSLPESTHRLGILSNPLSGRNKNGVSSFKDILDIHPTIPQYEAHTPQDIHTAISEFARQEVDVVVIDGGDGTVQAVLTVLFHHQPFPTLPILAILPSGTSNLNAGDVGLKGSRTAALQRLISWANGQGPEPTIIQRHVLRVQRVPNEDPIYGMFFGAGAIYQGAQMGWRTKQSVGRLGEVGASLIISRFFLSLFWGKQSQVRPTHMTISCPEHPPIENEFLTILVTTLDRLFLGLRPYWGQETNPLHYTAVKSKPNYLKRTLPSLLFGRPHHYGTPEHGYYSHNIQKLELQLHDGFTIDGEDYTPDPQLGPVQLTDGGIASFVSFSRTRS